MLWQENRGISLAKDVNGSGIVTQTERIHGRGTEVQAGLVSWAWRFTLNCIKPHPMGTSSITQKANIARLFGLLPAYLDLGEGTIQREPRFPYLDLTRPPWALSGGRKLKRR